MDKGFLERVWKQRSFRRGVRTPDVQVPGTAASPGLGEGVRGACLSGCSLRPDGEQWSKFILHIVGLQGQGGCTRLELGGQKLRREQAAFEKVLEDRRCVPGRVLTVSLTLPRCAKVPD